MQGPLEKDDLPLEYIDRRDIGEGHVTAIMSSLQFQHKLFLREMKGALLPDKIPLDEIETVMDFICGPGSWCIDFSKKYPEKQIVGVDINHAIIGLARENAAPLRSKNLQFQVIDRTRALPFRVVPPKVPFTYTACARGAQARNVAPPGQRLAPIGVEEVIFAWEMAGRAAKGPAATGELIEGNARGGEIVSRRGDAKAAV